MSYMIPKTLDNPMRALGVPIDTLMVFMGIWSTFVIFNQGLYGIIVGIVASSVCSRFRSRSILRGLIRFIYWYAPNEMNFIKGVPGHERRLRCK